MSSDSVRQNRAERINVAWFFMTTVGGGVNWKDQAERLASSSDNGASSVFGGEGGAVDGVLVGGGVAGLAVAGGGSSAFGDGLGGVGIAEGAGAAAEAGVGLGSVPFGPTSAMEIR